MFPVVLGDGLCQACNSYDNGGSPPRAGSPMQLRAAAENQGRRCGVRHTTRWEPLPGTLFVRSCRLFVSADDDATDPPCSVGRHRRLPGQTTRGGGKVSTKPLNLALSARVGEESSEVRQFRTAHLTVSPPSIAAKLSIELSVMAAVFACFPAFLCVEHHHCFRCLLRAERIETVIATLAPSPVTMANGVRCAVLLRARRQMPSQSVKSAGSSCPLETSACSGGSRWPTHSAPLCHEARRGIDRVVRATSGRGIVSAQPSRERRSDRRRES